MTKKQIEQQKELSDEEQRLILKQYLKNFYISFSEETEYRFNKIIDLKNISSCVIKGNNYDELRQAICYILLSLNRKVNYYSFTDFEIMQKMLANESDEINEDISYSDIENVPFLIIYHPRFYRKNKILWDTLNYLMMNRKNTDKVTIIITDATSLQDEHGYLSVDTLFNLTETPFIDTSASYKNDISNFNSIYGIPNNSRTTSGLYGD